MQGPGWHEQLRWLRRGAAENFVLREMLQGIQRLLISTEGHRKQGEEDLKKRLKCIVNCRKKTRRVKDVCNWRLKKKVPEKKVLKKWCLDVLETKRQKKRQFPNMEETRKESEKNWLQARVLKMSGWEKKETVTYGAGLINVLTKHQEKKAVKTMRRQLREQQENIWYIKKYIYTHKYFFLARDLSSHMQNDSWSA